MVLHPKQTNNVILNGNQEKWLFILPTDSVQGSEHIVKSLSQFVIKQGNISHVIILSKKKSMGWEPLEKEMHIVYIPVKHYFLGILFLIPYLTKKSYRSINYTFTSQTIINGTIGLAKRLGILKKTLVILRESNSIFDLFKGLKLKFYTLFYHLGYKGSSLIICQTSYMKNQLENALPGLTKKLNIAVISNPFSFNEIKLKSGSLPPQFQGLPFIVAAGRLTHAKGFDILIDAFIELQKHYESMHLIILGRGKDHSLLLDKIKQSNMVGKIHLPGYVHNVYSYFKEAQCCVLSSRIEGFPNVLLQMMSQNTRVVSTLSAGGIKDIPGLFTCPTDDIGLLRDTILNALKSNTDNNRISFENYLSKRTLSGFYNKIILSIR